MNRAHRQAGFTIIELSLAMGFVAMLLIAITLMVIQIGNIYNRGITMKEVNQIGRSLTADLKRSISGSSPFSLDPGEDSRYYENKSSGEIIGGRLCTGQYSYIWNYSSAFSPTPNSYRNVYSDAALGGEIRFIKVPDSIGLFCRTTINQVNDSVSLTQSAINVAGTEILNAGDRDLALHEFKISSNASDGKTGQRLYNIKFILGTNDLSVISSTKDSCKPPNAADANFDYCAINVFNITVRAGNSAQ